MTNNKQTVLSGRLSGENTARFSRLENMMYKPSELAQELGFSQRQFRRVYIPLGCPTERDHRNQTWINGLEFVSWYRDYYKKRKLRPNQVHCLTCRTEVERVNPN